MAALVTLALAPPASTSVAPTIEQAVARMSLNEKVGQLVMFSIAGLHLTEAEAELMERHHLGGVILFGDNYEDRGQLGALNERIQRVTERGNRFRIGALISADQEGGVVKRFPDMPPHYSAPRMGEIGRDALALDQGRATGRALRAAGVNVDLAPVADLDLEPNHIMRERAFGSNRYRVARLADAFARGLQDRRVAATAKHFPGLGGATINSDHGRAYVDRSREQLREFDALPFKRAIAGGIKMIMVGHGIYTRERGSGPASVNRHIATTRLRAELRFTGVAISDALEAITWRFDGNLARACAATIRAGVDVALITGGAAAARSCVREIRHEVQSGTITERRLDNAVERVLALKAWLGVFDPGA